jgi:hypothetical protein
MFPSILVSGRGVFRGFGPVDGDSARSNEGRRYAVSARSELAG